MSVNFERVTSVTLVAAALIVAGASVYRLVGQPNRTRGDAVPAATRIENWRQLESQGFRIHGTEESRVRLLIFADLECPACRVLHEQLEQYDDPMKDSLSITYMMFPLSYHRFARNAADATGCVGTHTGQLAEWMNAIYRGQDSIGLRSWRRFADDAGIALSSALSACLDSPPRSPKVDSSAATAERLGIDATPTILINGWKVNNLKSVAQFDSVIKTISRIR